MNWGSATGSRGVPGKKSKECQFRRRTPGQSAALLLFLADMNWGEVMRQDLTLADSFDIFYSRLNEILNNFYPIKKVKITNHDPPFINADIKNLLRKKNNLMRSGKIEAADRIASLIREKINRANSRILRGKKRGSKDLWKSVNQCLGKEDRWSERDICVTAEDLNNYFGGISQDKQYIRPPKKESVEDCEGNIIFSEQNVFFMLDRLRDTAPGLDNLPSWFLRLAAPSISDPLQYLFNQCLQQSFVPKQ